MLAAIIVGGIVVAICGDLSGQAVHHLIQITFGRIKIHHQWADFCAQEMIRAGGTKSRQRLHVLAVHKFQNCVTVIEVADHVLVTADKTANGGHQARRDLTPGVHL